MNERNFAAFLVVCVLGFVVSLCLSQTGLVELVVHCGRGERGGHTGLGRYGDVEGHTGSMGGGGGAKLPDEYNRPGSLTRNGRGG